MLNGRVLLVLQKHNGVSSCSCNGPWKGARCETSTLPACSSSPCGNGATCVNAKNGTTGNGFTCHCPIGFSGPTCHQTTDRCMPDPCRNGGTCVTATGSSGGNSSYSCKCAAGWAGAHCQVADQCLKNNPCQNGGTCQTLGDGGYRCQCVPGYVGDQCLSVVDYCVAKPCANGGTCENLKNDFRCRCRPGFGGKDCSRYVSGSGDCASAPCANGGTCIASDGGGFRCECTAGYSAASNCAAADDERPTAAVLGDRSKHVSMMEQQDAAAAASVNGLLMIVLSVSVPVAALAAIAAVLCMKNRRRRDQKKADQNARMQNEQNSIHSVAKLGDPHVIRNSWDPLPSPCVVVGGGRSENVYSEPLCFAAAVPASKMTHAQSASSLQRQKLLNTDRQNRLSFKEQQDLDRRISVISVDSSNQCNNSK